jgi:hypothetical protein
MPKRCFVISPIGESGSAVREHADDVFDFIIKPAMDELGIHAYRADQNQQIGRITEQMFNSIIEDDLCVAVLTFFNPNVFYELAVAQCAARPVIILIEKGHDIPFDVRDLRAVEYDLRPRPLRDKVYVKQIVELVESLEAAQWTVQVPFGKNLTPLGSKKSALNLYEKIETYGTSERWLGLVRGARKTFDLSGITLRWWMKFLEFRTIVSQKAEQGCKVRILLMHPDNPALPQYIHSGIKVGGIKHVAAEIQGAYSIFKELSGAHPNIQVRQVRVGCLTHHVVKNDELMLIALLLYSQGSSQHPLLECYAASPLYKTVEAEFDTLWELNNDDDGATRPAPVEVPASTEPA